MFSTVPVRRSPARSEYPGRPCARGRRRNRPRFAESPVTVSSFRRSASCRGCHPRIAVLPRMTDPPVAAWTWRPERAIVACAERSKPMGNDARACRAARATASAIPRRPSRSFFGSTSAHPGDDSRPHPRHARSVQAPVIRDPEKTAEAVLRVARCPRRRPCRSGSSELPGLFASPRCSRTRPTTTVMRKRPGGAFGCNPSARTSPASVADTQDSFGGLLRITDHRLHARFAHGGDAGESEVPPGWAEVLPKNDLDGRTRDGRCRCAGGAHQCVVPDRL